MPHHVRHCSALIAVLVACFLPGGHSQYYNAHYQCTIEGQPSVNGSFSGSLYLPMWKTPLSLNVPVYYPNMFCTGSISTPPDTEVWIVNIFALSTQSAAPSSPCNVRASNQDVFAVNTAAGQRYFCGNTHSLTRADVPLYIDLGTATFNFQSNNITSSDAETGVSIFLYATTPHFPPSTSRRKRRSAHPRFIGPEAKDSEDIKGLQHVLSDEDETIIKMVHEMMHHPPGSHKHTRMCDFSCKTRRLVEYEMCCRHWYMNGIQPKPCDDPIWGVSGWYIPECPAHLQLPRARKHKKSKKLDEHDADEL